MAVGVPYDLYWGDMTPNLLRKFHQAYERQRKDADDLNHMLGKYISIGINNPAKYPKKPFLSEDTTTQTPQEFQQIMKQRYTKKE